MKCCSYAEMWLLETDPRGSYRDRMHDVEERGRFVRLTRELQARVYVAPTSRGAIGVVHVEQGVE